MQKGLVMAAVLGLGSALPATSMAEEAVAPESPHSFSGNLGLFSQYIWRGMTQTDEELALQGGVDYAHASGLYAGAWASNVSWTTDLGYMDSNSLELDLYAGFAGSIGKTGLGYNVGLLQYLYPGTGAAGQPDTDATEIYGGLSYNWFNVKASYTVSDEAWGFDDASGTVYYEANADIPLGENGLHLNLHVGSFHFDGETGSVDNNEYDYEDWKIGITKAWDNGVKLGAYWTDNNADNVWAQEMRDGQFTVFVQKLF